MRRWSLMALLTLAVPAAGQETGNVLPADGAPRKMLYRYLLGEAQKHFDARRQAVAALKTPAEIERRQRDLRAKFVDALGGFPDKTPLNARTVGVLPGDGYRVEKVIYESRPNHHVTANLYLPDGKGPFPAVLMPIGHSSNGKAADYVQRGSILLARNGLAVLAYDPIGQGERMQLLRDGGKPGIPSSTTEHTLIGVGALLVGDSTATYRIWDGIRSLDYLESRPEIDAKRLGCTGCSGGGTLTSYLMALDERVAAAAPSCYITSLERLFATIGPQDAEQNIPGQVAFGMEHADYLTMRAPRPTLICAATRDFFDIQGTWTTFREAKLAYGVLGYSERVDLAEFDTKHGYPRPQREAVVRWMRRWLLHKDDAPFEDDFPIAKDRDLTCTRSGQVLEDLKGKSVFHLTAEKAQELAKQRALAPKQGDSLLREVRKLLGLPAEVRPAELISEVRAKRKPARKAIVEETEPGILIPGFVFDPGASEPGQPIILYVNGAGSQAGWEDAERLLRERQTVVAIDLRGLGETAPSSAGKKPGHFGVDFKESFLAMHLNRPLLGQRVHDLLAVVASHTKDMPNRPIHVIGIGTAGPIVLHAAALDPRIQAVTVERSVLSWTAVARTALTYDQLTNVVPGALKVYDLPELAATLAPRPLTIRTTVGPDLEPSPQADVDATYTVTRQAYERAGAAAKFVLR